MKKFILTFISLFFLFGSAFSAFAAYDNSVTIDSGKEFHKEIMSAKNIYIYVTFENTLMWTDTQTIDEYLVKRKNRGNKAKEDKEKMINNFYKKFDNNIKLLGSKWKLTRTENPKDITDGYIIYFNYDKCLPLFVMGTQGFATINIYKAEDQTKSILEGSVISYSMAKSYASLNPTYEFSEIGQRFAKEIVNFLHNINVK